MDVAPSFAFQAVARADGKTLRWVIDGENVEITSRTNVLTQATQESCGCITIRDTEPKMVRLQAADRAEWVLPNRTDR